MDNQIHVLGISGSNRRGSSTRVLVSAVGDGVIDAGGHFELFDLSEYTIPPLDTSVETPTDAQHLTEKVKEADAVVLGTPMYHGSFSGQMKCALDYCGFEELEDTTVGLAAVAGGSFPTPALNHLRISCRSLNAWTLPKEVAVPNVRDNISDGIDGTITNSDLQERAHTIGEELVNYASVPHTVSTNLADQNQGAD